MVSCNHWSYPFEYRMLRTPPRSISSTLAPCLSGPYPLLYRSGRIQEWFILLALCSDVTSPVCCHRNKKILKFHCCECMWNRFLVPRDGWDRDICFCSFLQISDKADNDIYTRSTFNLLHLVCCTICPPSSGRLLASGYSFRQYL